MHASSNAIAGAVINGDDVLTQHEPTPWLFSPGIDGVVVIALTTAGAAVPFARRPAAPAATPAPASVR